jgi:hypothetical protein
MTKTSKKPRPSRAGTAPIQTNTKQTQMQYSNGRFANSFASGLKVVKSSGLYRVYARSVNQNGLYFLMSGSRILHVGKRAHILRMWKRYEPAMDLVARYLQA